MSATTMRNQLQANADANGNATMYLAGNWELNHNSAWRLFVQLQGILNGVVTVLVDGIPVDGGLTTNLQFKCGPVFINQNSQLQVTVTGMTPTEPVSCYLDGIVSDNVSDFAALAPPGYGGGSVQNDPSQLLTAEVGPPLVENQTYGVLGSGSHNQFVGQFNISGYAALLLYGNVPNASVTSLFAWLQFDDKFGNRIAFSQIDNLCPKFCCIMGCYGTQVEIYIGNTDSVQHNINSFTVIPLTSMPTQPARLIPIAFGSIPGVFTATETPPSNTIVYANSIVAPSTTVNNPGNFVWYGRALWTLSPITAGAVSGTSWWAQLSSTDASGNTYFIDVMQGSTAPTAPREVWLPSGMITASFRNTGASNIVPTIHLQAA